MSVREIVLGNERFTAAHILVFTEEELASIFGEAGVRLRELAQHAETGFSDLVVELEACPGYHVPLRPCVALIAGIPLRLEGGLTVPPLLDDEFLVYLLFDLPKTLDGLRRAVVVEDLDERFTRDVDDGIRYALDILGRVSRVYRVPVIVTGGARLAGYTFDRRIVRPKGEGVVYVDGEPFCEYSVK